MSDLSIWTIGIDLGDRKSRFCAIDATTGEVVEGDFSMTEAVLREHFSRWAPCRVAFEVGGHSRWVKRVLAEMGFAVIVADPRRVALITKSQRKTDRNDAMKLAQLAAANLDLLNPVHHRDDAQQADLAVMKARDILVRCRSKLINAVCGQIKATGERLERGSTPSFHRKKEEIPDELRPALEPLFDQIESLTQAIRAYDRQIEELAETRHAHIKPLLGVKGVGALTAIVYCLTLGDPKRFKRSRHAASFLGLCPRQHESGTLRKELGITKAGDPFTRRLLVQAAHYIMGPFGEDCDLRRWGEGLARRGGKAAKKRAVIAVARKLAVLLHRLWADQSEYAPLRKAGARTTAA